ncbi:MAG TPA: PKD domain-containing protein [Candidatus Limnocylindria bacterium]
MKLPFRRRRDERTRGQAMVEFAIILPILAVLMVMSLDFGRVFFGWVGMQNVARVSADFAAAHPDAFDPTVPSTVQTQLLMQQYQVRVANEAAGLNCSPLPVASPSPTYMPEPSLVDTNGNGSWDVGEHVRVQLWCGFGLLTPLAEVILGGDVDVAADSVFAIRGGSIGGIPIGSVAPSASASSSASSSASGSASASASASSSPCPLPIANFNASPTVGKRPLTVAFTDASQTFGCAVSGWVWDFGDGSAISTLQNPTHIYTRNGLFQVTLTVTSPGGEVSTFKPGYIHVCGNC